jgi:hypothetical protein
MYLKRGKKIALGLGLALLYLALQGLALDTRDLGKLWGRSRRW